MVFKKLGESNEKMQSSCRGTVEVLCGALDLLVLDLY